MIKERKQRYLGRIEIFAEKEIIQDMISKGYPYIRIYEKLFNDKKINVTYRQFCRLLLQYLDIKSKNKRKNPNIIKNISSNKSIRTENKAKPFGQHDKNRRWDVNING